MYLSESEQFGIEFDLDNNYGGQWMFGRVCYRLGDIRIGDYDLGTSLRDILYFWERIACYANKRTNEKLMLLNKEDLINLLSSGLFGNRLASAELTERATNEEWARHDVIPTIDVFDNWHVFLVENDEMGRCIYQNLITMACYECRLAHGEFDRVLNKAIQSLSSILESQID